VKINALFLCIFLHAFNLQSLFARDCSLLIAFTASKKNERACKKTIMNRPSGFPGLLLHRMKLAGTTIYSPDKTPKCAAARMLAASSLRASGLLSMPLDTGLSSD
jgi:hypothetical protein